MRTQTKPPDVQERYIEKKVSDAFVKAGWLSRKCQWVGRNGAPDRLFVKRGVFIFVEFKQFRKKATDLQKAEHEKLRAAGCRVEIIDSVESGLALLGQLERDAHGDII